MAGADRQSRCVERFAVGGLVYLALSVVWIYGVLDQGSLEGSDARLWAVLGVLAAAHVAFGFGIREWPALLLPIAVLLLAIPAGYPESQFSEPLPVWFGQLVMAPFETLLIAAGLGIRAFADRRRAVAARSS